MNSNSCIKPKYAIMSTTPLTPSSSRGKDPCGFWRCRKGVGDTSYHSASDTGTPRRPIQSSHRGLPPLGSGHRSAWDPPGARAVTDVQVCNEVLTYPLKTKDTSLIKCRKRLCAKWLWRMLTLFKQLCRFIWNVKVNCEGIFLTGNAPNKNLFLTNALFFACRCTWFWSKNP